MSRRSPLRGTHALIAASALATAMLATAGVQSDRPPPRRPNRSTAPRAR